MESASLTERVFPTKVGTVRRQDGLPIGERYGSYARRSTDRFSPINSDVWQGTALLKPTRPNAAIGSLMALSAKAITAACKSLL
jgi:hypothetical protein